jgi:hypothetical protein
MAGTKKSGTKWWARVIFFFRDKPIYFQIGFIIFKFKPTIETKLPSVKDRLVLIPTENRLKWISTAYRSTHFSCVQRVAEREQQTKLKSITKSEGFSPVHILKGFNQFTRGTLGCDGICL